MSKVTLASGSFVLGAYVMYLLASQTSTIVHSAFAQTIGRAETGWVVKGAEPMVPKLRPRVITGLEGEVKTQSLDGFNCGDCTIVADEITYAGGAYLCDNCVLKANRIVLKGAALNTFILLHQATGILNTPAPPNPNKPNIEIAANKKNIKLNLASPAQ